jgi:cell division protein FtsB
MESDNILLVICLTLFLVVGLNAAIFVSLRGGGTQTQIELFRRAAQRARQPWKDEDEALQELSRRVAALKEKRKNDEDQANSS